MHKGSRLVQNFASPLPPATARTASPSCQQSPPIKKRKQERGNVWIAEAVLPPTLCHSSTHCASKQFSLLGRKRSFEDLTLIHNHRTGQLRRTNSVDKLHTVLTRRGQVQLTLGENSPFLDILQSLGTFPPYIHSYNFWYLSNHFSEAPESDQEMPTALTGTDSSCLISRFDPDGVLLFDDDYISQTLAQEEREKIERWSFSDWFRASIYIILELFGWTYNFID